LNFMLIEVFYIEKPTKIESFPKILTKVITLKE
jgi:hypothetical protein